MPAIPPFYLLIPFGIFLLVLAFLAFMNIFNLLRYGARNAVGFFATFVFLAGVAVLLFLTWQAMPSVDWTQPLQIYTPGAPLF